MHLRTHDVIMITFMFIVMYSEVFGATKKYVRWDQSLRMCGEEKNEFMSALFQLCGEPKSTQRLWEIVLRDSVYLNQRKTNEVQCCEESCTPKFMAEYHCEDVTRIQKAFRNYTLPFLMPDKVYEKWINMFKRVLTFLFT